MGVDRKSPQGSAEDAFAACVQQSYPISEQIYSQRLGTQQLQDSKTQTWACAHKHVHTHTQNQHQPKGNSNNSNTLLMQHLDCARVVALLSPTVEKVL